MSLDQYLGLIPDPNSTQPKYMDWVGVNLQPFVDDQTVLDSFTDAFDLNQAVGVQLDKIGELLQLSRRLKFQPGGGLNANLSDDRYRLALKAKILLNIWKGTKQEIYDFWRQYLPQYPILIGDGQDMSMTVLIIGMPNDTEDAIFFGYDTNTATIKGYDQSYWEGFDGVLRGMVKNHYFLPKPAGVKVNYAFTDTAAFAYDFESDYLKGYDAGSWITF